MDLPGRRLDPVMSQNEEGQIHVDPTMGGAILGG
jgi:hypothetical protein